MQKPIIYSIYLALLLFSIEGNGQTYVYSESHQEYLKSDLELNEFDRNEWEIIKRSIVDGVAEESYEIREGEGNPFLTDKDNPYKQSRKSYNDYLKSKKGYQPKRLPEKDKPKNRRDSSDASLSIPSGLGTILAFIIIPLFALLIFYLFFKAPIEKKSKSISKDLESMIPTEIPKTELELLLDEALDKEDYREAIRIYFIFIIRGLIVKDWIVWEKEKTNFSYLAEMRNKPYASEFESTVSVYEIVWYGERKLTKEEYYALEPRFKNLVKNLDQ